MQNSVQDQRRTILLVALLTVFVKNWQTVTMQIPQTSEGICPKKWRTNVIVVQIKDVLKCVYRQN